MKPKPDLKDFRKVSHGAFGEPEYSYDYQAYSIALEEYANARIKKLEKLLSESKSVLDWESWWSMKSGANRDVVERNDDLIGKIKRALNKDS